MKIRAHSLLCATMMLGAATLLEAQTTLGPNGPVNPAKPPAGRTGEPIVYRLTLTPAPESVPPLKYALYPRWDQLTPGNSVPMWYRAIAIARDGQRTKLMTDNYDTWFVDDLQQTPVDEIRTFLANMRSALADARIAAFREETDWDLGLRDLRGPDTIAILLGEFQDSRQLARILSLSARLHLLDGDFDAALADMLVSYRLAHDVAEPETFINDLIGIAIIAITDENLRHFMGMAGSPNMYWALAALPEPRIDVRAAAEAELSLPERMFPWMKDPASESRTPDQWQKLLQGAMKDVADLHGSSLIPQSIASDTARDIVLAALCLNGYPTVKRDLLDLGYPEEEIDAMPVGQAIAVHQRWVYQILWQNQGAAMFLPYAEGQQRFEQVRQEMRDQGFDSRPWQGRETLPIADALLPAVQQVKMAQLRRDAMRAALMTIEAIRMHLAVGDGTLPQSLDDITVVPVPKNPWTEAPFDYVLRDGVAVIDLPLPNFHQQFELRVAEQPESRARQ